MFKFSQIKFLCSSLPCIHINFLAQPMKCTKLFELKYLWYTQMSGNKTSVGSNEGQCVWFEIGRDSGYVPGELTDLATS